MNRADIISKYTYIKIELSYLKNHIDKGHISKEQAWDFFNEYINRELIENYSKEKMKENIFKSYPKANKDVIDFIINFNWHNDTSMVCQEIIRSHFRAGWCYYFAIILKEAFNRGEICWCAPYGHICWVDEDGIPYDIEGVCDSECEYYIPIKYIKEGLADFKHVTNIKFNASKEYIENAIIQYEKDLKSKEE